MTISRERDPTLCRVLKLVGQLVIQGAVRSAVVIVHPLGFEAVRSYFEPLWFVKQWFVKQSHAERRQELDTFFQPKTERALRIDY